MAYLTYEVTMTALSSCRYMMRDMIVRCMYITPCLLIGRFSWQCLQDTAQLGKLRHLSTPCVDARPNATLKPCIIGSCRRKFGRAEDDTATTWLSGDEACIAIEPSRSHVILYVPQAA
eukprot:scpid110857/ scgid18131/ 